MVQLDPVKVEYECEGRTSKCTITWKIQWRKTFCCATANVAEAVLFIALS